MKGIVYNITWNGKIIYIGSTKNLKKRIREHKHKCYNKNYNTNIYQFIRDNNINWEELSFEIIKEIEVETRKELTKIEGYFIKEHKNTCLNLVISGRTRKEYNKEYEQTEKRKEYKKKYQQTEKRKEYYKQRYLKKKLECME